MSKFEFLMMIASVIVAFAMTELVGGWGRLTRAPGRLELDWLYFGWSFVILLATIGYWLGMWAYVEVPFERNVEIYFLVLPTLFLVFAAFALTPGVPHGDTFSLRDHYWSRCRAVFLSLAAFLVFGMLADLVIAGGEAVAARDVVAPLVLAAANLLLAFVRRVWLHALFLALNAAMVGLFLLASTTNIDQRFS